MRIGYTDYIEFKKGGTGLNRQDDPDGCFVEYVVKTDCCWFSGVEYIRNAGIDGLNAFITTLKSNRMGSHRIKLGYDGDLNLTFVGNPTDGSVDLKIDASSVRPGEDGRVSEHRLKVEFRVESELIEAIGAL